MSSKLSQLSPSELQEELVRQRTFVQSLDMMVLGQISSYLKLRTTHVLQIFAIKKLLGIRKIRDAGVEKEKIRLLEAEVKKRGYPTKMLSSFYRSVIRYARWLQAKEKKN